MSVLNFNNVCSEGVSGDVHSGNANTLQNQVRSEYFMNAFWASYSELALNTDWHIVR